MRPVDLRSDTVTRPSAAMRGAMAAAAVGDDGFGDDPTVAQLEAVAAERVGMEAAVFVPSGTMANLIAVMTHTAPGDEILLGRQSHIFNREAAGAARLAGVLTNPLDEEAGGTLDPERIAAAASHPADLLAPRVALLCIENTQNLCGGAVMTRARTESLTAVAHAAGLRVHLDGARVFNAAIALGIDVPALTRGCDSVAFCLSKGLGCPVGSLLCGSHDFIERARRNRKMLGGGMRQAGILAAAGLYALEHNVERLAGDHANARRLAAGLRRIEAFRPNDPETNIVTVEVVRGEVAGWLAALRENGVLAVPFGPGRLRMVTHLDVAAGDVDEALERIVTVAAQVPA